MASGVTVNPQEGVKTAAAQEAELKTTQNKSICLEPLQSERYFTSNLQHFTYDNITGNQSPLVHTFKSPSAKVEQAETPSS